MNRKNPFQDSDQSESSTDFEDRALDSMLRGLVRSADEGHEFADQVMSRVASESKTKPAETFFGFAPLAESVQLSLDESPPTRATAPLETDRLDPKKRTGVHMFKLLIIAASIAIPILLGGWWMFYETDVPVADSASNKPQSEVPSEETNENAVPNATQSDLKATGEKALPRTDSHDSHDTPDAAANQLTVDETAKPVNTNPGSNRTVSHDPTRADQTSVESEAVVESQISKKNPIWELVIEFNKSGSGKATINDEDSEFEISMANLDLILGRIGHAVIRRVCYLEPALKGRWTGMIRITGPYIEESFGFESLDEMQDAFVQARRQVKRVKSIFPIATLAIAEPVINDVIAKTDLILHKMIEPEFDGNALVFVGLNPNPNSKFFKNYRTIGLTDLIRFVETGHLQIPEPTDLFVDATAIQDLDAKELTKQLDATIPPVEMFTDIEQFKRAESMIESVSTQGRARNARREMEERIAELIERRKQLTDRYELNSLNTEIRKHKTEYGKIVKGIFTSNTPGSKKSIPPVEPLVQILPNRQDLQGLSLVMGRECHIPEADAKTLDEVSKTAGRALARFDAFGSRNFFKHNGTRLRIVKAMIRRAASSSNAEQALSTLDQMLQMEQPAVRLELVEVLRENNSPTAIGLLSCYAKYDLEPSVRIAATDALRGFPADAYRASLLDGLTYPWPAVAKNAAEALIRLNDTEAVPQLVELLNQPDPRTPKQTEQGSYIQRELVSINHMRNCTLCHADSQSNSDLGRGLIPVWGKPLPQKYYNASEGAMVRADVTYLRQDFSVIQKVKDPAPWPEFQRFDYVVRGKLLSQQEYQAERDKFESQPNIYHAVIAKALRMLTHENPGDDSYEIWKALVGE